MTTYKVYLCSKCMYTTTNMADAEKHLDMLRHSFYAMVHPQENFYIKTITQ